MKTLFAAAALFTTAACDMGSASVDLHVNGSLDPDIIDPTQNPDAPSTSTLICDLGYTYLGFGGTRLEAGREDEQLGYDRDRVKPYSALGDEYARVLGTTPDLLTTLGSTFGEVPPRWYIEPQATAVSLYSALRVAFVGCLDYTNTTAFDAVPDATNAPANCAAFAASFWNRAPDTNEVAACVSLVTQGTPNEPVARRKWAYACASVLSSAPFLTF